MESINDYKKDPAPNRIELNRSRPDINQENLDYYRIIKAFILEHRNENLTYNKILREVFLAYMTMNRIKTFIPEEDLKRFEKMRDMHIVRVKDREQKEKQYETAKTLKR